MCILIGIIKEIPKKKKINPWSCVLMSCVRAHLCASGRGGVTGPFGFLIMISLQREYPHSSHDPVTCIP
jgi:hypothetical protein